MPRPPALQILRARLEEQQRAGLGRSLVTTGPATGPRVTVRGKDCLLMASNDYLGLSRHPRLAQAAAAAAQLNGTGSGASRLVSGTLDDHLALEEAIARFKHSEAALFLSSGYLTNLAAVCALAGPGDLIVSDELNHASLIDACRLSRAKVRICPHGDAGAAGRLLAEGNTKCLRLLLTDGVFSMDGDMAPLPALLEAARSRDALLMVDDAHATGVWGPTGRGTAEHYGLNPPPPDLVMIGTLSKALGGMGGFVAAAGEVIELLVNRARPFIFSTAPPPAQVAAAKAAFALVDEESWRRSKLHELAARLRARLCELGFTLLSDQGPIIPLLAGEARTAVALAKALWKRGVFAPAIRPPTVPKGTSRLRITVTAAHGEDDVDFAAAALQEAAREAGL